MVDRHSSRLAVLLVCFCVLRGQGSHAGEQLTLEQLAESSIAIAIVDNPLNTHQAIRSWLLDIEPVGPFSLVSPLCIPDREMLQRWKKRTPDHPGVPIWDRSMTVGHINQLVFFTVKKGTAVPHCETEVMLGETFSTHVDYKKNVERAEALLRKKKGLPDPEPAKPPPTEVVEDEPPPPKKSSGCF